MTGVQLFWKIVMVVGIILAIDGVVGMGFLANILGPSTFLIAGIPQIAIGIVLTFFGWKNSK